MPEAGRDDRQGKAQSVANTALEFIKQVRTETAKVVWPTRRETVMTGVMVVIMTSLLGLFFFGIDTFFGAIVQWLLALASGRAA
jgi:preprotein translocase subunit SecE